MTKSGILYANIFATIAVCILLFQVPSLSGEETPSDDQLSNKDVEDIVALLGRQEEGEKQAEESDPVPSILSAPNPSASNSATSLSSATVNQDEIAQSLALLNTLFSASGQSGQDLSALFGAVSPTEATTTTTTTTTTENTKDAEAAAAQLLTALLSGGGGGSGDAGNLASLLSLATAGGSGGAGSTNTAGAGDLASLLSLANAGGSGSPGNSASDAGNLSALLSLANAGGTATASKGNSAADAGNLAALLSLAAASGNSHQPQQQKQQQQQPQQQALTAASTDAQNAALLSQLLSAGGGQGVKQQDFKAFQNAGGSLDPSSSNQLTGALNLLSTLGTLGSLASPQAGGGGLLSGLLRAGGGGGQAGLLGLLGGQQQQRPGLLSSLGNLASVVGTTLGGVRSTLGQGPAKLRGVDTRLGLGYRFGENADAQVLWEIGPQLFTEPLTDEQKLQLKIQQERQQQQKLLQAQQQQASRNPNRRIAVSQKRTSVRVPSPFIANSKTLSRRHVAQISPAQQIPKFKLVPTATSPTKLRSTSKPMTLEQLLQPPPAHYRRTSPASVMVRRESVNTNKLNYYAKEEANPLTNANSQLTEYEQWLLHNPHRNQIHQQQYMVNSPAPKQRKDAFTFTKDNKNNIVRVRVQRRQVPSQVQVVQAVGGISDDGTHHLAMNPVSFSSRMGFFQRRTNPGADDSYLRRNAVSYNPRLREIQREQARQEQQVRNIQRRQRERERLNLQRLQMMQQQSDRDRDFEQSQTLERLQSNESKPTVIISPSTVPRNGQNSNRRLTSSQRRRKQQQKKQVEKANPKTLTEWSENTSFTDMVSNYVINRLKTTGNAVVKHIVPGASLNLDDDLTKVEQPEEDHKLPTDQDASGSGFKAVFKGFLGIDAGPPPKPPKPLIKIGEEVPYDELRALVSGGQVPGTPVHKIPTLSDSAELHAEVAAKEKFPSPPPEIFIDIANGEVSMRKAFGTMESFTPPPPEYIPEDHPRHVFNVLKHQLAQQYEKIKLQQLKEAAKQIRKEKIAQGLSNPHDPLYVASGLFDLVEKESKKKK